MMKKQPTKRSSKRELIESLKTIIQLLSSLTNDEFNEILARPRQRPVYARSEPVTTDQIERIAKILADAPDLKSAQQILSEDRVFASKDALISLARHFHIAVLRKDKNESIIAKIVRRLQGAPQGREAIRTLKL